VGKQVFRPIFSNTGNRIDFFLGLEGLLACLPDKIIIGTKMIME
jgi:hypothetical protein